MLGTGERAQRLVNGLRSRSEMGIEVVGWSGNLEGAVTRDSVASHLLELIKRQRVHRVIVAMPDRRGTLPVHELLQLRLNGIKIEEAASWLERMSGRIEVEQLYPSWLIFTGGFRFSSSLRMMKRFLSTITAAVLLLLVLPVVPFVILLIKLDSRGPVLYRQKRMGRAGATFYCYKFRTMRRDAEADTGATWATDDDPRITRIGRMLRISRLDEIPQLWCVLKGDMAFVGPRPERPEFIEWLSQRNSVLSRSARRASRHYGLGAGSIQVWQHAGRCAREVTVRSLLHQERIAGTGSADHVRDHQDRDPGSRRAMKWISSASIFWIWIFWGSAAVIAYTYFGYPGWLWLRGCWRRKDVMRGPYLPFVSVVMVVRNEERYLQRKLGNLLSLDYPAELMQLVVVSDGSTDRTEAILAKYASNPRVNVVLNQLSRGKASGLNDAFEIRPGRHRNVHRRTTRS